MAGSTSRGSLASSPAGGAFLNKEVTMQITFDFEGATPSENCEWVIFVDKGGGDVSRHTSEGDTVVADLERVPADVLITERFKSPALSRTGWRDQQAN